jgi:hypothetical protein
LRRVLAQKALRTVANAGSHDLADQTQRVLGKYADLQLAQEVSSLPRRPATLSMHRQLLVHSAASVTKSDLSSYSRLQRDVTSFNRRRMGWNTLCLRAQAPTERSLTYLRLQRGWSRKELVKQTRP